MAHSTEARFPSKWVAHCHCSRCWLAHGAAFVTWVGLHEAQLQIEDTRSSLRWYAAGTGGERGFCSLCGSTLFFRGARWPGEIHVTRANFLTPPDREPQAHAYYDTHVDWVELADQLPHLVDPATQA